MAIKIANLKKGFFRDAALTSGTNFLLLLLALATGVISARILGAQGRGELAAIRNWAALFVMIGRFGLPFSLTYFIARDPRRRPELLVTTWAILFPAMMLLAIVGYSLTPLGLAAQSSSVISEARLYLLIIIALSLISITYGALQAWEEFFVWNAIRVLDILLFLAVLVVAWETGHKTAAFVANGFLITRVPGLLMMIVVAIRHGLNWQTRPDWEMAKPMLSYGVKSMLGALPQSLNGRLDQLLLAMMLPAQYLGLYAVAVTWSLILGPLVNGIATAIFPHLAGQKSKEQSRDKFARVFRITVLIVLVALVPHLLITSVAVPLIFGSEFTGAVSTAYILIIAAAFWHINSVMASGLQGIGKPSAVAWAQGMGLAITILLLYLLISQYQIIGAAIASLAAYIVTFVILLFFCRRHFEVPISYLLVPSKVDLAALRHASR